MRATSRKRQLALTLSKASGSRWHVGGISFGLRSSGWSSGSFRVRGLPSPAFVAYQQSRSPFRRHPNFTALAIPKGLIAPESANNGVTSGTRWCLCLVLGIPGGATAAIMLVVMQFHGVSFRPVAVRKPAQGRLWNVHGHGRQRTC